MSESFLYNLFISRFIFLSTLEPKNLILAPELKQEIVLIKKIKIIQAA
jgi:hypothetical protein